MNELYPDLEPKARISKVIEEFIWPELQGDGFSFISSNGSLKRKINGLVHEIYFPRHKRNQTGIFCGFDVSISVTSPRLNKWYKLVYGKKLLNSLIMSHTNDYIPSYKNEFDLGYNLSLYDNENIIRSLVHNMRAAVSPYLNLFSSYTSSIDNLILEENYFMAPMMMDMCEIIIDEVTSRKILTWFREEQNLGTDFMQETLNDIEIREARLQKGYNESLKNGSR